MAEQVNEVINSICEKLGVAANYLIPEMARMHIAQYAVISVFMIIIIAVAVAIGVAIWKRANEDEYMDYDAIILYLIPASFVFLITGATLFNAVYNLAGWIASPTAMTVTELTKLL